jgi:hypothetical protein
VAAERAVVGTRKQQRPGQRVVTARRTRNAACRSAGGGTRAEAVAAASHGECPKHATVGSGLQRRRESESGADVPWPAAATCHAGRKGEEQGGKEAEGANEQEACAVPHAGDQPDALGADAADMREALPQACTRHCAAQARERRHREAVYTWLGSGAGEAVAPPNARPRASSGGERRPVPARRKGRGGTRGDTEERDRRERAVAAWRDVSGRAAPGADRGCR